MLLSASGGGVPTNRRLWLGLRKEQMIANSRFGVSFDHAVGLYRLGNGDTVDAWNE